MTKSKDRVRCILASAAVILLTVAFRLPYEKAAYEAGLRYDGGTLRLAQLGILLWNGISLPVHTAVHCRLERRDGMLLSAGYFADCTLITAFLYIQPFSPQARTGMTVLTFSAPAEFLIALPRKRKG